jgi:deoxyribodipyrimidine photo-lyase
MKTAVVLFTRDLRVHDNPALAASCRAAETVVPLFVHDPTLHVPAGRARFLTESLADLRRALQSRGGDLVELRGDPVEEAVRVARKIGADGIAMAADVSSYARRREQRLTEAAASERFALKLFPGVTIVDPGAVRPGGGGDHYKVFTPYWRAWSAAKWRDVEPAPRTVTLPRDLPSSWCGALAGTTAPSSGSWAVGGETEARKRAADWSGRLEGYDDGHDDLPGDRTSRLSPYLHFGCLSPRELAATVEGHAGADPFVRQLCWRDFYHQVLMSFPALRHKAYRANAVEEWRKQDDALEAWKAGETGMPVVDAGMRQLRAEGWMHNRARLITASYLTKGLGVDWRAGGDHFFELLLDADVANNYGNWQWVAGTGNDTKPYRRFNPVRQAERFDPVGDYVRRYVPELSGIAGKAVHQPPRVAGYPPLITS